MTYIVFLKFFHVIAIFLAGGLGVANGMLTSAHQKAGTPPTEIAKNTMLRLARLGLVAILILWITGIALTAKLYGGFDVGWAFNIKLFGATIFVGRNCFHQLLSACCGKEKFTTKSEDNKSNTNDHTLVAGRSATRNSYHNVSWNVLNTQVYALSKSLDADNELGHCLSNNVNQARVFQKIL